MQIGMAGLLSYIFAAMVVAQSILFIGLILGNACQEFSFVVHHALELFEIMNNLRKCSANLTKALPEIIPNTTDIPSLSTVIDNLVANALRLNAFGQLIGQ